MVTTQQKPSDKSIQNLLPPPRQWPDFINLDVVALGSSFNCAGELLDKAVAEGHGAKIAIYSPAGNWTYQELLARSNQIAHVLVDDLGLIPGNRVLLRSANNPLLAASWLGVVKAGGIVVTTMALLRAREIATIATQSRAIFGLCDHRLKDDMDRAVSNTGQFKKVLYFDGFDIDNYDNKTPGSQPNGLAARMATKPVVFDNYQADQTDIAMIAFTSGTTGKPKGAVHSHHAIMAVCETFSRQVLKPTADDIFAGTPPLGFVYGLGGLLLFPLHARASSVLLEDTSPPALVEAIEIFKISVLFTAPTVYKLLLELFDVNKHCSLEKCVSAGEVLSAYVSQRWLDKANIRLIDGIGSTELLHIFISIQDVADPVGTLGKVVPGYQACVVDERGHEVMVGELGLLAVRGPTGCRYLDDERQADYVVNGWNITGDTVKVDQAGHYWYQARSDGMIISSGYNIAGPEVEQVIGQHPAIAECAVIGAPDPLRGNIVMAYVVLKRGYEGSKKLIKEIQDFAKQSAAPYKYPRSVEFIDKLPRTPSGKVQHFLLREKARKDANLPPA